MDFSLLGVVADRVGHQLTDEAGNAHFLLSLSPVPAFVRAGEETAYAHTRIHIHTNTNSVDETNIPKLEVYPRTGFESCP